jgi:starch synthase (maltosyl-transferring)
VKAKASTTRVGDHSGRRFHIEDVYPIVDGGRYPVKRVAGEPVDVWVDIFRDGHDVLAADLVWRPEKENKWRRAALQHDSNDRWAGRFVPDDLGHHVFAIEAWTDTFATWRREVQLKRAAGQDVSLEAKEGRELVASFRSRDKATQAVIAAACEAFDSSGDIEVLLSDELAAAPAPGTR